MGKANGAPPAKLVLVGSIPTLEYLQFIIRGWDFYVSLPLNGGKARMLKCRELADCHVLYDLMVHPEVFPFVRQKADSYEAFLFLTKQTIQAEQDGKLISRTILDEWGNPIGTINLFDVQEGAGFLGTWIGRPYFGKGYNQAAKEQFFSELFYELEMDTVYMRIRKVNVRSNKAALKLPYVSIANETNQALYEEINANGEIYNLYKISKDQYTLHTMRIAAEMDQTVNAKEA
jgi:RimJ/RimL family protein N-acetyltransferase